MNSAIRKGLSMILIGLLIFPLALLWRPVSIASLALFVLGLIWIRRSQGTRAMGEDE